MIRTKILMIVLVLLGSPFLVSAQQKKKPVKPSEPAVVKPKPAPVVVKEPEAYSYLLVTTDLDISVSVNFGRQYNVSSTDEGKRVPLEAGDNLVKITPLDGGMDGYTETITIEKKGNRVYAVKLNAARQAEQQRKEEETRKAEAARRILEQKMKCNAMVSATERRAFMCYNLGAANMSADPFTPSWEINGGYWQWGRREMAASGPSGPGGWQANDAEVSGWNEKYAPSGSWREGLKTVNDPCPSGYRVPTHAEWDAVLKYNSARNVGTWEGSATNYSSGKKIGNQLFLPAAGYRYFTNGALSGRGYYGGYWSSTESGSTKAWYLGFDSGYAVTNDYYGRALGRSVRCIAE